MHTPFSEWRFSHNAFIFQPRTLAGIAHQLPKHSELDPAYAEAAFDHLDEVGMSNNGTRWCGDAIAGFTYGA